MTRRPDPNRHHRPFDRAQGRRSIRLPAYDYRSPGAYFVTICTRERECLFGDVVEGEVKLSAYGKIANWYWQRISRHAPHVRLDAWGVMPNHLHGVLWIVDGVGATHSPMAGPLDTQLSSHQPALTQGPAVGNASPLPVGPASGSLGAIIIVLLTQQMQRLCCIPQLNGVGFLPASNSRAVSIPRPTGDQSKDRRRLKTRRLGCVQSPAPCFQPVPGTIDVLFRHAPKRAPHDNRGNPLN
jgi:hypothetical protein